jgi:glycosyltransferase involved in cell wall biosynthesis
MAGVPVRVKLLHLTTVPDSLWAFFGGQIRYMTDHGVEVEALSSPGRFLTMFADREQVPVHAVPMARRINPGADLVALVRLLCLLRRIRPHIVHAHTPKAGLLGMLAARISGIPVRIYHIHGFPFLTAAGAKRRLLRAAETLSCRLATRVLCVSRSVAELAVAEGVCPAGSVHVLAGGTINGIDARTCFDPARVGSKAVAARRELYGIPADATVIGFVGRLVKDKGVAELEHAWRMLAGEFPALHLLVCGAIEDGDPVSADVLSALRADARVHLAGEVADMPACYAIMDVLALPTYREGFPLVPLEASAMEKPVVASAVPGCTDAVLDGVTGTLVPAGDPVALAAALRRYLDDPALRARHGEAGRARVLAEFRQDVVWSALLEDYRLLLAAAGVTVTDPPSAAPWMAK